MPRLLQCLLLFAKAGINPREMARQVSRIDDKNGVRRWLHRRCCARKGSARLLAMTGKFLAVAQERQGARIVGQCRGRVLLNLGDCFVKASLVDELIGSRESNYLVLGIRRSLRQSLGGFVESTLCLKAQCLPPECGLVPGCQLQGAINDRPRFVIT